MLIKIFFVVVCEAPKFCCESGIQGDQECKGMCIEESWINDGNADCSNGSDEGISGILNRIRMMKNI